MDFGSIRKADSTPTTRADETKSGSTLPPFDNKACLSLKVHSLASDIYKELESLVPVYGSALLHNLTPLLVTALENLESLYTEKQDLQLSLSLFHEDKRHLISEYEREKSLRRTSDARLLKLEDEFEEFRKLEEQRCTEQQSSLKVLELKVKNLNEQIARYEEREQELLNENEHFRSRHSYLLRSFTDYVERTRNASAFSRCSSHSLATDTLIPSQLSLSGKACPGHAPLSCDLNGGPNLCEDVNRTPHCNCVDMQNNPQFLFETERQRIIRCILETTPELHDSTNFPNFHSIDLCFDELSQGDLLSEDGHDVKSFDGSCCTPQINAGDAASVDIFHGVKQEVNNLIQENQDLVQTKNALNVVTNDLIGRIDDLTCENVRLSSERTALISHSNSMLTRIKDLESQCRRLRHELDSIDLCDSLYSDSGHSGGSVDEDEHSSEPLAMRRYFSRIEMARVLLERNCYKEELLDLQDALRWTETLRAERIGGFETRRTSRKRGPIWNWFSQLFSPAKAQKHPSVKTSVAPTYPIVPLAESSTVQLGQEALYAASEACPAGLFVTSDYSFDSSAEFRDRSQQGITDWIRISDTQVNASTVCCTHDVSFLGRCTVLSENMNNLKLWCAAGTFPDTGNVLSTCLRPSGAGVDSLPLSTSSPARSSPALSVHHTNVIDERLSVQGLSNCKTQEAAPSSNVVWVCSVAPGSLRSTKLSASSNSIVNASQAIVRSLITIIDARNPQKPLDSFAITTSTVTCLAAVPGNSLQDQRHLQQTETFWRSVSLDLSEELLSCNLDQPFHFRDTVTPVNGQLLPQMTDSICRSTYSCPVPSAQPSFGGPCDPFHHVMTQSTSKSCDWDLTSAFSPPYFVERRRFRVRVPERDNLKNGCTEHLSSLCLSHRPPAQTHSDRPPNSSYPTMWIGCYDGDLYIHSTMANWRVCLHVVHLPDTVTQILPFKSRIFVGLANGQYVVFRRRLCSSTSSVMSSPPNAFAPVAATVTSNNSDVDQSTVLAPNSALTSGDDPVDLSLGSWDLTEACVITCDHDRSATRPAIIVPSTECLWSACHSRILVINLSTLKLVSSFEVPSAGDTHHISHVCSAGIGVWVSLRSHPVLSLFHSSTYRLMQTLDLMNPILHRLIDFNSNRKSSRRQTPRIISPTALLSFDSHLWIGTDSGLVLTAPFARLSPEEPPPDSNETFMDEPPTIAVSKVYASRHQHSGSVRFLVCLTPQELMTIPPTSKHIHENQLASVTPSPQSIPRNKSLILSGGRGYSFVINSLDLKKRRSENGGHLIVWGSVHP